MDELQTTPGMPDHWHTVQHASRFGYDVPVLMKRQGRALFVKRTETANPVRIMDLGGNPPLQCDNCGEEI